MTRSCAVPNCDKEHRSSGSGKRSMFKVPKNEELREKWKENIPGLKSFHSVCEKHFEEHCIVREYIHKDNNGAVILRIPLKMSKLGKCAVPTIFVASDKEFEKENNFNYSSISNQMNIKRNVTIVDDSLFNSKKRESDHTYVNIKSPTDGTEATASVDLTHESIENAEVTEATASVDLTHESIENAEVTEASRVISLQDEPVAESTEVQYEYREPSFASSFKATFNNSVTFQFNIELGEDIVDKPYYVNLIKPWSVCETCEGNEPQLLFTCPVSIIENGISRHIFEKTVIVNADRRVQYEVYCMPVNVNGTCLPKVILDIETIPEILKKFQSMRICKGFTSTDISLIPTTIAFKSSLGTEVWRSNVCELLCKNTVRCNGCQKLRKTLLQKESRLKKRAKTKLVAHTPDYNQQFKLNALRKKLNYQRRLANRLKVRIKLINDCLAKQQEEIAKIREETLDLKCSDLKVPHKEKLAIKEILAAAKVKSPHGRRYSQQWIMLCTLMNIRSPSYYEFLRKNEILPLPCSKTVRDYFSLMGSDCGFDESFFEILGKKFNSKDQFKRHGIICADEINLRRAISVSSRNLTYLGVTDNGDSRTETDISADNLATHGLVIMYQSLTEKYSQPIATFASKNPVAGDELAKIMLKSICLLEKAGAFIHGIIGDGASTNRKMQKTLGVVAKLDSTKSWFMHPLHNERKVFVFSDTPHLFKNVRNRLYNKRKLRVHPDKNYIQWDYLEELYNVDSQRIGNARVCPKLTKRHVELDNTAKMRVRLATQILSNSAAIGLQFYLSHKFVKFKGCDETIAFCKRMNDLFDALNRKVANEGLTLDGKDFKIIKESLEWLNEWENNKLQGLIHKDEFLTEETAHGLRLTLISTMDLCQTLSEKYDFKYLLTGKVNQDNLEVTFASKF